MNLTILGTGNAAVTKIYNTCFVLREGKDSFLVDGGGGNTILSRLDEAGVSLNDIHTIFVTHKHMDHLFWNSLGDEDDLSEDDEGCDHT